MSETKKGTLFKVFPTLTVNICRIGSDVTEDGW